MQEREGNRLAAVGLSLGGHSAPDWVAAPNQNLAWADTSTFWATLPPLALVHRRPISLQTPSKAYSERWNISSRSVITPDSSCCLRL